MRIFCSSWAPATIAVFLLLLVFQHRIEAGSKKHFAHEHDNNNKGNGNDDWKSQYDGGRLMAPEFAVPGREYRFRYDSQTASGYASWISTQRSMSRFQALVNVQFGAVVDNNAKEATLRLSECQAGQLNGKPLVDAWNPARIQPIEEFESNGDFQHQQLERPVRFTYDQGTIDAIHFSPGEPSWSKNIKKAVLNMLQLQLAKGVVEQERNPVEKRIDQELAHQAGTIGGKAQMSKREQDFYQLQKSFTQNELTIEGDCQCQYTMVPMDSENGQLVNVTKSINFDSCKSLSDISYGMQADEEGKQRGEEEKSRAEQQQDVLAHLPLNELVPDVEWQNRSGSPMIAKQVLDRSTTMRYVLSKQQQQEQNNKKEQPGLDVYGIQHVELVSQYVLKSAQPETSQAMQTVAAAQLRFLGAKTVSKKSNDESFESEVETLMYNSEMEAQEKCFFMFGDDTKDSDERQCPRGASTPYPFNYPSTEAKIARAVQLLQAVAMAQQQQGNVAQNDEPQQQLRAMNTAENMDELIQTLRYCTEKELTTLKNSNELNDVSRQFLADALAAAGTRNTLKVLLARIESGEFSDLRAAQLIKTFSRGSGLPAPSDKIADLVLALCKSAKVQKSRVLKPACWLSFGAIVGELNQQQRVLRHSPVYTPADEYAMCPAHKMELYTKALIEQFTKNNQAESVYDSVIALKAIGNAALDSVPQALIDSITSSPDSSAPLKVPSPIRTNAIEALRRIPSRKVHKLLLPVYLNQQENQFVRIIAFSVISQCQIPPSVPMLDQIAFAMSRENNSHVLSYTYTTLKAMARSPAKRHQKIAQHIKTALRLAGVDEQELARKCNGVPSQFGRSTAYYNQEEHPGVFLEAANVFYGKNGANQIPNHMFISLSSLLNGQFTEEKLRLTLCQWNLDKFVQSMLLTTKGESNSDAEENGTQSGEQNEDESEKNSYLSHAKEQIKSIWSRLKGTITNSQTAEQQQQEEKWQKSAAVSASLRVNNIDTITFVIGDPEQQQNPMEALKQMLLMAGVGTGAEYANGVEKPALEVNGILYWQERAARIGTSVGHQLNIQQKSTVFGQLRADLRKLGSGQYAGEFRPAFTYAGMQKMKTWAGPVQANGVKRVVAMEAMLPLKAQLTVQPQQQQIKLAIRVPQSSIRVFALHTLPSTFISESARKQQSQQSKFNGNLHFGERIHSVQNEQLKSYQFTVDKTAFESMHMPVRVQGVLHRPRRLDEMKEWAKVLFASENHYQVTFEPQSGSTPRELAQTISWSVFNAHSNTPGAQMRTKLRTFFDKFEQQNNNNMVGQQQKDDESSSSSSSSEEHDQSEQQTATERKLAHMQSVLNKLIGQKAYKHTVKYTLETVGGEDNKRAELQWEIVCDARFIACEARTQMKYYGSTTNGAAPDWEANMQSQHLHANTMIDMDQIHVYGKQQQQQKKRSTNNDGKQQQHEFKRFIYYAEAEWGTPVAAAGNADQQQIKFYMNAEPSEEMLLLFRDYLRANRTATIAGNMQQQQQQLPKNAGRPFVNMYQMMADYKLRPAMANIFSRTLEMAKTRHYMNTDTRVISNANSAVPKSSNSNTQYRQGQLHAQLSIDPVTHKHVNITVRTQTQFVRFRQIELLHPVRPLPIVHVPVVIRPTHSVSQMIQQRIGHPLRTRAECRLDTRRQLIQTFDGIESAAPISKCWTVLAKHCAANANAAVPEFAVLIKSIPGTKQKKLKVISSDMGVLVVEPRSQEEQQQNGQKVEEQLQVRIISGENSKNTIFTSEMTSSQVPEGIEFAHGGTAGKETVIIESEQSHVQVRFNGQTVRIELNGAEYQSGQCGLCGNWDNEANNDQQTMPNGAQAKSAMEFQRAYAIEDEVAEEQQGCTRSALDEFYAQQADKFNVKWSGNQEGIQKKGSESQQGEQAEMDGNAEGMEEIEPKQQTKVIEYAQQLCFSIRPVKQCPIGSYATTRASVNGNGDAGEIKKQKVPFTCVQRASLEAKRLKQQARRGEAIQLGEYPASFQEVVVVPERCIKY